ncbi:MAG: Nif3-like dinuclear metal center hexameric protein [Clostridia bacterium]|nr:Nif3-like dinuclear metal center hexameric protein [Clostridia bacterium]
MIKVNDVFEFLNGKFPVTDACDFDNVGILVGDKLSEVSGILVALDCTKSAVNKALEIGANLIVTHHPVIFDGLKSVLAGSVVFELCKNNISVISMHTNFDVGIGGVNDILCERLGLKNVKKFEGYDGYLLNSAETDISNPCLLADEFKKSLLFPVRFVAGRPVEKLLVCSGSGGNFISDAVNCGFDGLVTADVKQNHFVEAENAGISLFDCGHFATENVCVKPLEKMLKDRFSDINITAFEPNFIHHN